VTGGSTPAAGACRRCLSPAGLARGAREVLATELHEAAHGLAAARGIRDTSRQSRYHNARYRRLGACPVDLDDRLV
jgi:hypothetical protein